MTDLFPVDIQEQIREVKLEIKYRNSVYPRQIMAGKMSEDRAARRIEAMEAVLRTLERVAKGAR